jgi:ABC-type dipeptide/oligopeptide/nickel transport system permease component
MGNLGNSMHYRTPALPLVLERLPATLELALVALLMAMGIAIPLGLAGGARPGSLVDFIGRTLGLLGQTTPAYWLGLVMILVFAVQLRWLPTAGRAGPLSVIMPALTLALPTMGRLVRLTRSAVMEIMGEDYVRTARGKGLADRTVFYRHVLRNAGIPLVSVIGIQFGYLLGGSVIIESVFAWPGIGRLAIDAIANRDFPVVQAVRGGGCAHRADRPGLRLGRPAHPLWMSRMRGYVILRSVQAVASLQGVTDGDYKLNCGGRAGRSEQLMR